MNLMKKYAIYAIAILQDCMPNKIIPKVEITQAKSYAGRCVVKRISYKNMMVKATIRLSSFNHMDVPSLMSYEDHIEIIDTICHELAHVVVMPHCKEHSELTEDFKSLIISYFEVLGFLEKKKELKEVAN
jgi:predicted SprT family Zn-dependent metalloprotease